MENISLKEENYSKENINNFHSKKRTKNKIMYNNDISLNNKTKKRTRQYSPSMDIEEEQISEKKDIIKKGNKRMKVPLRKLVERIHLDEKEPKDAKNNNKNKNKNPIIKRGIKIFSDMSVSEISNNLFKNYYPCLLPSYYPDQIQEQIIDNQVQKLISNFNNKKNEKKNVIKITPNMDYLRELAEKQGEWITHEDNGNDGNVYDDREDKDDEDYDKSDSNDENNSNNTYPEDESIENEDEENNYNDYDDYDNNDDYENEI